MTQATAPTTPTYSRLSGGQAPNYSRPERAGRSSKNVATKHPAYDTMMRSWQKADLLFGGTESMRAAGQLVLPAYRGETPKDYDKRKGLATLNDYFVQAVWNLCNKAFQSDSTVYGTPLIEEIADDIDRAGNNTTQHYKLRYATTLRYGVSPGMVDAPLRPAVSLFEARRDRNFPFVVPINPWNLTYWQRNAYGKFAQATIFMPILEEDAKNPFNTLSFPRLRHFRMVSSTQAIFQDWLKTDTPKAKREADGWEKYDEGLWWEGVDFLPFAQASGIQVQHDVYRSRLEGLADQTMRHFRKQAEQEYGGWMDRSTILSFLGIDQFSIQDGTPKQQSLLNADGSAILDGQGQPIQVPVEISASPTSTLFLPPDPSAQVPPDLKYIQRNNAPTIQGFEELKHLEEFIALMSLSYILPRGTNESAARAEGDNKNTSSVLHSDIVEMERVAKNEWVFIHMREGYSYQEAQERIMVNFPKSMGLSSAEIMELEMLYRARVIGDIGRDAFLEEMKDRSLLSADREIGSIAQELPLSEQQQSEPQPMGARNSLSQ